MPPPLATMLTLTTYGMWLRGDVRGWVDRGRTLPPDPELEHQDRRRMPHPPFRFLPDQLLAVGQAVGTSLIYRMGLRIGAMSLQVWHLHVVIAGSDFAWPEAVKCAKDAARWHLRPGRPIWSDGYDKRFCFDIPSVRSRIAYVERHNLDNGWPAKPWPFIQDIV